MCIRDSPIITQLLRDLIGIEADDDRTLTLRFAEKRARDAPCLLYTSDAADERSSVDLGGRRIIKKKKQ